MKQNNIVRRLGYRPRDVVEATGFSLRTVQRKIASGELVAHRCGSAVIVYPEDLEAWLNSLPRVTAGSAA
ncbi:helix-turn-helix domain-containing protein [Mycobacteroides chelonae]|uniref:helix-turn-helix domain-containing protein n=1 Tax=Mycobacteroides chelonae TaxID=1774 RepID=UPI0019109D45|nr:helix-turn-helix domain-containing protein [Mycobacteroides chelonae]QQG95888.1 helix-turn-helix domain-containing protein [Mycobacteroides chelonae]